MTPSRFEGGLTDRDPRIGVLYPCSGTRDRDFWELAPQGASVHVTRLPFTNRGTKEAVTRMSSEVNLRAAASLVAEVDPTVVIWADTSGSFLFGPRGDEKQIQLLAETTGAPATTTSTAIIEACRWLGIDRVDIASPYIDDLNDALVGFLEASGVTAGRVEALRLDDSYAIASVPEAMQAEQVRAAASGGAPAVLVPCTDYLTLDLVPELEDELDCPILAANAVTMWDAMRLIGGYPQAGRRPSGRLFLQEVR